MRQQRLVDHHRPEIGTADADVDHGADRLARDPHPLAGTHLVGEGEHLVQHLVDVRDHVLPVDRQLRVAGQSQRGVQHGAILGDVDVFAAEHRIPAAGDVGLFREPQQRRDDIVVDQVLRQIDVQVPDGVCETGGPFRIVGEGPAEIQFGIVGELVQLIPGSSGGGINRLDHGSKLRSCSGRAGLLSKFPYEQRFRDRTRGASTPGRLTSVFPTHPAHDRLRAPEHGPQRPQPSARAGNFRQVAVQRGFFLSPG